MSGEPGHVYGAPTQRVVHEENEVNHRLLCGQIATLLEDSQTVCKGVQDRSVDDRSQERPCGTRCWRKLPNVGADEASRGPDRVLVSGEVDSDDLLSVSVRLPVVEVVVQTGRKNGRLVLRRRSGSSGDTYCDEGEECA